MSVIVLLLFASLLLGTAFLIFFIRAVRGGQFADTTTPAMRILADDEPRSTVHQAWSSSPRLRGEERGEGPDSRKPLTPALSPQRGEGVGTADTSRISTVENISSLWKRPAR